MKGDRLGMGNMGKVQVWSTLNMKKMGLFLLFFKVEASEE